MVGADVNRPGRIAVLPEEGDHPDRVAAVVDPQGVIRGRKGDMRFLRRLLGEGKGAARVEIEL